MKVENCDKYILNKYKTKSSQIAVFVIRQNRETMKKYHKE